MTSYRLVCLRRDFVQHPLRCFLGMLCFLFNWQKKKKKKKQLCSRPFMNHKYREKGNKTVSDRKSHIMSEGCNNICLNGVGDKNVFANLFLSQSETNKRKEHSPSLPIKSRTLFLSI